MARAGTLFRRAGRGSITGTKPFTDSNFNFELKNDHGRFENRHQMFKFRFETIIVFIYKYHKQLTAAYQLLLWLKLRTQRHPRTLGRRRHPIHESSSRYPLHENSRRPLHEGRIPATAWNGTSILIFIKVTCFVYNFSKLENN